jgi:hypothetical protein
MNNPLLHPDSPRMPKMNFPFYTPFMEGRNELEALMEHAYKTPDYHQNEFISERRHTFPYVNMENKNRFRELDKWKQKFYSLLEEIYREIEDKKPKRGNAIFYIGSNWQYQLLPSSNADAMEMIVWVTGAWVDAKFMDEPIQSPIQNHIPKK